MLKREDLPIRYKNLVFIELLPTKNDPIAVCRCDCGNIFLRSTRHYYDGKMKGHCGCLDKKNQKKDEE